MQASGGNNRRLDKVIVRTRDWFTIMHCILRGRDTRRQGTQHLQRQKKRGEFGKFVAGSLVGGNKLREAIAIKF